MSGSWQSCQTPLILPWVLRVGVGKGAAPHLPQAGSSPHSSHPDAQILLRPIASQSQIAALSSLLFILKDITSSRLSDFCSASGFGSRDLLTRVLNVMGGW